MGAEDLMHVQAAHRVKQTVLLVEKATANPAGAAARADALIADVHAKQNSGQALTMHDQMVLDVATRVKDVVASIESDAANGVCEMETEPEGQIQQENGDALAEIRADPKGAMRYADSIIAHERSQRPSEESLNRLQAAYSLKQVANLVEKVQADPAGVAARADQWISDIQAKSARGEALSPADVSHLSVAFQAKAIAARFAEMDAGPSSEIVSAKHGAAMAAVQAVQ
jgi:hypothetical protein